ncbi:hypothetical protein BABINDRAFT_165822 [Babjeviella inositovora NRRL Y-12698]|uniref:Glycerol-3-phosphate dehydrogenase n=1 Tax=Babjeviella inositovora NRRL Y-12698 TaxID=984486 RepID=A0A1E3QTX3_9ASCO|nr:uncharacterized protein BABINDRAFT_165822 [Babjeviella inositovora NRRL Y-12698]ODQ81109.1 hypothetical protein BABINDRAFT_165822 [Babjeviella inositovora NRRL Y-12698]
MFRSLKIVTKGRFLAAATAATGGVLLTQNVLSNDQKHTLAPLPALVKSLPAPPTREAMLKTLETTDKFDVLVIGGGAVGTGTALDAQTRGLNVCMVEKTDFACGTSSKSTKMAHGGVRYLEKAFFQLSKAQLDLVIEALNERAHMLNTAPHLCTVLPIIIPVYKYWQVPYFWAGCKMYDLFAGTQNLRNSFLLSKNATIAAAPMLDASTLKAGLVYHDGSFNDSRMNSSLAITATEKGATVLNYVEVKQLLKENGKVVGAVAVDRETGKEYKIKATAVVNATGPFADTILEMDNDPQGLPPATPQKPIMVVPSTGVHVIFPDYYVPKEMGLLDPATADGRVMFFLPWQGKCLAGTTDNPESSVPENPIPTEADIQDILNEMQHYVKFPVRREDVLSAWSGIRPLVRDPSKVDPNAPEGNSTQGIVRSHLVYETPSDLITISGGKWTTYREMSEDTVNHVVKKFKFADVKPCQTRDIILAGGENFESTLSARLCQEYNIPSDLASHLSANYGTRAPLVCEIYQQSEMNKLPVPLAQGVAKGESVELTHNAFAYPFTVAELKYCISNEYARKPIDFLARRTRLAFLDAREALKAVDGVVQIMGDEFKWDNATREKEAAYTREYIQNMGLRFD